ncbi:beta-glucosidase [Pullulanibacillus pueri]|uniref:Beta-glucosidase n=1 Tax=Pullulanibacillus pueri TaxID=1437324 RepID=A0A8J2ZZB1_9BACL|nr:GH1 family beta-glucosidase [Pullulanibacillus pueri]MBM7680485.1 beta-glucosidase [Pullulanibacillus pueri]GGH88208.1 beta-glucosidase [Pullulanibacillus pueri]
MLKFPKNFLWGAATASYQIEGGFNEDGRGESIWDRFCQMPGHVFAGHDGKVACDHFHRYEEDIKIMSELGLKSYRFSIAWSRLFPKEGHYNEKGLAFYRRLVTLLHSYDIEPVATIYHWDLPQWIQDRGGWANRETVDHFVEYAETLFRELGQDVNKWITHNEPWCAAFLGHGLGIHAPGHRDWHEALRVGHHLLLSHGRVVQAYRNYSQEGQIGITLNLAPTYPGTDKPEDVAAAHRSDGFINRIFLDPVFKGIYPQDMIDLFTKRFGTIDFIQDHDLQVISQPIDFLGINYYQPNVVIHSEDDQLFNVEQVPDEGKKTAMDWSIHPEALYDLLKRIQKDYSNIPLYVTENGAAFDDQVVNGEIHDEDRIEFLDGHFRAAHQFIQEGGNLQGYFVWSFLDNFEWAFGYSKRFGIVYVDYESQERLLKDSAKWYKEVIHQNAVLSNHVKN